MSLSRLNVGDVCRVKNAHVGLNQIVPGDIVTVANWTHLSDMYVFECERTKWTIFLRRNEVLSPIETARAALLE